MRGNKRKANFPLKGKVVFFATDNIHKFEEARSILAKFGIALGMLRVKGIEMQSDNLREIAETSVRDAFKRCGLPVILEDAGLFIDTLKDFPGPYASYAYKTIGNMGVLKLMENVKERKARFRSAIAYFDSETEVPVLFEGEAEGEITVNEQSENAKSGFGFDPIFKPSGSIKTFAQMSLEEKNGFSHRGKAVRKFAEWYRSL